MPSKLVFLVLREAEIRRDLMKDAMVIAKEDFARALVRGRTFLDAETESEGVAILDRFVDSVDALKPDQTRKIDLKGDD